MPLSHPATLSPLCLPKTLFQLASSRCRAETPGVGLPHHQQTQWCEPDIAFVDDEASPLPEFPPYIEMMPIEREFWEGTMAKAWQGGKAAFLHEGVPILVGDKEKILEQ